MTTKSIVLDVQVMLEVLAPLPAIAAKTDNEYMLYKIQSAGMEKTALKLNNVTDRKRLDPTVQCNNMHGKKYTRSFS